MFSYFSLLCFCILLQFSVVVMLIYVLLVCVSLSTWLGCEVCGVVRLFKMCFCLHLIKSQFTPKKKNAGTYFCNFNLKIFN